MKNALARRDSDQQIGTFRTDAGRIVGTGNVYLQLRERNPLNLW